MTKRILLAVSIILLSAALAAAGTAPDAAAPKPRAFGPLLETLSAYFKPLSGTATSVEGDAIRMDLGTEAGIINGMRLDVLRKGETFYHPVTKEPMGTSEKSVGLAEVTEAGPGGSALRLLSGEAREGDIIRISSSPVRALFYQSSDVDWDVSEEYYFQLKDLDRFQLFDSTPGKASDHEILLEAQRHNAEIAIVLSAENTPERSVLRQRLIWVRDSVEFSSSEVGIGPMEARSLKVGDEIFLPKKEASRRAFKLPYSAALVATGDVDGDGEMELAISTDRAVMFYAVGISLTPALEGLQIESPAREENIWLELSDLNADGRDEVIITTIDDYNVQSYVYKYGDGKFSVIFNPEYFIRYAGGILLGQEYSRLSGYKGEIFAVPLNGDRFERLAGGPAWVPKELNLHDFALVKGPGETESVLAYDRLGRMLMFNNLGGLLWRSPDVLTKEFRTYDKDRMTEMTPAGKWHMKDRIIPLYGAALAVRRVAYTSSVDTELGFKEFSIVRIEREGDALKESVAVGDLGGKALDYALWGDKLFLLAGSAGFNPLNLLKGESMFTTGLYIITIKR